MAKLHSRILSVMLALIISISTVTPAFAESIEFDDTGSYVMQEEDFFMDEGEEVDLVTEDDDQITQEDQVEDHQDYYGDEIDFVSDEEQDPISIPEEKTTAPEEESIKFDEPEETEKNVFNFDDKEENTDGSLSGKRLLEDGEIDLTDEGIDGEFFGNRTWAQNIIKGGNADTFMKNGPVATVRWGSRQNLFLANADYTLSQSGNDWAVKTYHYQDHSENHVGVLYNKPLPNGTTTVNAPFTLLFKKAAILNDGSYGDVEMKITKAVFVNWGDTAKAATLAGIKGCTFDLGWTSEDTSNGRHGVKYDVNVRVLKNGSPVNGTAWFLVRDLDIRDHLGGSYSGEYAESVQFLSGVKSSFYIPSSNFLYILGDGSNLTFRATQEDDGTYDSGFAVLVNTAGFSYRWAASRPDWEGNLGTQFFTTGHNVRATSSVGGIIKTTDPTTSTTYSTTATTRTVSLDPPDGKNLTYTMTPNTGYYLGTVKVDGNTVNPTKSGNSYTYNFNDIRANHTIDVTWVPYKLTINYYSGNSRSDAVSGDKYNADNVLLRSASYNYDGTNFASSGLPNYNGGTWKLERDGYKYSGNAEWHLGSMNGKAVDANTNYATVQAFAEAMGYPITTKNQTINLYAKMEPNEHKITTSVEHGTITPSDSKVVHGSNKEIKYSPEDGYYLKTLTVDGSSVNVDTYPSSYTFKNVTADHTIKAVYTPYHKITTSVTGGTITKSDTKIKDGEKRTITYTPNDGYYLNALTVDGASKKITDYPSSYDFTNIMEDHTVKAEFLPYRKITTSVVNGTITPQISNIKNGESKEVTYAGNDGYFLTSIVVDGQQADITSVTSKYNFNDIQADHDIKVYYSQNPVKGVFGADGSDIDGKLLKKGDQATYKITLYNSSPSAISVNVSDDLPDNIARVVSIDNDGAVEGKKITWSNVSVPANGSKIVSFVIEAAEKGTVANTAGMGYKNISLNTNQVNNYIIPAPTKKVVNDAGEDINGQTVEIGENITYQITIENTANVPKDFTVTDRLPDHTRFISASDRGVLEDGIVKWTLYLGPNTARTLSFTAAAEDKGAVITNKANMKVDHLDFETNQVTVYTLADPEKKVFADNKDADGETFFKGDDNVVSYQISFLNIMPESRQVKIEDDIPDGMTILEADHDGQISGNHIEWNVTAAAKEKITVSAVVRIDDDAQVRTFKNTAIVTSRDYSRETNPVTVYLADPPVKTVLDMTGTDIDQQVVGYHEYPYRYEIEFHNPADTAKPYTVKDTIPAGIQIVSASDDGQISGNDITWNVTVDPYSKKTLTVDVLTSDRIQNPVLLNEAEVIGGKYKRKTNLVTNYVFLPDHVMRKGVENEAGEDIDQKVILSGDTVVYKLDVINPASAPKTAVISDQIPADMQIVSTDPAGASIHGTSVSWENFPFDPEEEIVFTIKAKATDANKGYVLDNAFTAQFDGVEETSNHVSNSVMPDPVKDVKIGDRSVNGETVPYNSQMEYSITVKNPSDLEKEFTITDDVPDTVSVQSVSDNGTEDGGVITWKIMIPGGETKVLTYQVIADQKDVDINNEALVSVDDISVKTNETINGVPADPVKSVIVNEEDADRLIQLSGTVMSYSIQVKNPMTVKSKVLVKDPLPEKVSFISADHDGSYADHQVAWELDLEPKQEITLHVIVNINDEAKDSVLKNKAVVTFSQDLDTNTVVTPVQRDPVKTVKNAAGENINGQAVSFGDILYYSIQVSNPAEEPKSYTITDEVPDTVSIADIGEGGVLDGGTITWNATVDPKSVYFVEFTAKADQKGVAINNEAIASADKISIKTNETINGVIDDPVKSVFDEEGKEIDRQIVLTGDTLNYKIRVHNPLTVKKAFTVTDEVSEYVELLSADQDAKYENDTIIWNLELDPDEEETVSYKVRVKENAQGQVVKNIANVFVDSVIAPTNEVVNPVQKAPVKTVSDLQGNDVDGHTLDAGSEIIYTIHVENPSEDEKEYTITDAVPDTITVTQIESDGKQEDGSIIWNVKIPAAGSADLKFHAVCDKKDVRIDNIADVAVDDIKISTNETKNGVPKEPVKRVLDKNANDIDGMTQLAGNEMIYTITAKNPMSIVKNAVLADELPEYAEFVETDYNGKIEGRMITWDLAMQPEEEITVHVRVKIADGAKDQILKNQAVLTFDNTLHSNEAQSPVIKEPVKRVLNTNGDDIDGALVSLGEEIVYEISFRNPAGSAKDFTIKDKLPDHVLVSSISDDGTLKDGEVTWTVNVQPLETRIVSVTVKPDERGIVLKNKASVSVDGSVIDTNEVKNEVPDRPVKKVLDKDGNDIDGLSVLKGTRITYQISFTNVSDKAREYVVTDKIPDVLEDISVRAGTIGNGVATWIVTARPDETLKLEVSGTVKEDLDANAFENEAELISENWKDTTNKVTNLIAKDPVKKVMDQSGAEMDGKIAAPGDILTYEITIDNPSRKEAHYIVTDDFDESKVVFEGSELGKEADGKVIFDVMAKPGKTTTVSFKVKVKDAYGIIKNKASVQTCGHTKDTNEVVNYILPGPVKSVSFKGEDYNAKTVLQGSVLHYDIKVHNPSPNKETFVITDKLQDNLTFEKADHDGKLSGNTITWTVEINGGSDVTVGFDAKVGTSSTDQIDNTASVSAGKSSISSNKVTTYVEKPEEPVKEEPKKPEDPKLPKYQYTPQPDIQKIVEEPVAAIKQIVTRITGDASRMVLWIVLIAAVALGLGAWIRIRKKK